MTKHARTEHVMLQLYCHHYSLQDSQYLVSFVNIFKTLFTLHFVEFQIHYSPSHIDFLGLWRGAYPSSSTCFLFKDCQPVFFVTLTPHYLNKVSIKCLNRWSTMRLFSVMCTECFLKLHGRLCFLKSENTLSTSNIASLLCMKVLLGM